MNIALALGLVIKLYALLTPTAILSAFISYTSDESPAAQYRIACKTGLAIYIIGQTLLLFGSSLFAIFGFTLDAFRIGVGLLLFLEAVALMRGDLEAPGRRKDADISVVPLAIPLGMGPSTIGAVIVMGASESIPGHLLVDSVCLFVAALGVTILLCLARQARKMLRHTGLLIMSKLTALLISAIAAQVIFTGIRAFWLRS